MRQIIKYKNLTWVDITEPTQDDISYLENNFRLHPLTLKTIIPAIHHPDLDVFKNYIFIILHYAHTQNNGEVQIREFDIIAGKNYLITNHYQEIPPLNFIFQECFEFESKKREYMEKGSGFLLFVILNKFLKEKIAKIDQMEDEIDLIEKEIFLRKERELIEKISSLKGKIISFWRVIEPQKLIFESLRNVGGRFFGLEYRHYFSVLFRMHRRIENVLKTSKEAIESLEETNHIVLTLKTNEVIRILTIFSVILLPLTLLASIWGMNLSVLPLSESRFGFLVILGIMSILVITMIFYFKKKKWI